MKIWVMNKMIILKNKKIQKVMKSMMIMKEDVVNR